MRTDGSFDFLSQNKSSERSIRFVIDVEFDASNILRFTSDSDITGTSGAGVTVIHDCVSNISATSQKLNVAEARSEIGAINFELTDKGGLVSSNLKTQWDGGRGIRQKTVRLYVGFEGQDFSAMRLEQTQIVDKSVTTDGVSYKVQCSDIQRTARKDIFAAAKTKLSTSFLASDTTMFVYDTSEFHMNPQGPSYSIEGGTLAAPNMRGYLKIKYNDSWEIVSYTGKTATSFTGITSIRRGLFGTTKVDHTISGTPSNDNGIDVEEYIYLELPSPKLLYAILSGKLYGYPSSTYDPGDGVLRAKNILPDNWHLGIADSFINLSTSGNYWPTSLLNQPRSLWDKTNDAGYILRFEGAQKTDGKAFYEKEICLPTATFTLINAAGQIGLKTIYAIMSQAAHSGVLNVDNVVDADEIVYDLSAVHNTFDLSWGYQEYPEKKDYFRRNILVDDTSVAKHGEGTKLEFKFKGVHANKNTIDTIIHMFDALRERHCAPPIKLKCDLLPTMSNIEVGDIFRVTLPHLIDHTTGLGLDRAMEVQSVSVDQDSGKLSVELFGSTELAQVIDSDKINTGTRLTNSWYTSAGSAIPNVTAGVLTANTTLTGSSDFDTSVFYVNGDFEIPSGKVLTITGNVQLRIKGFFHISGTGKINGKGGGMAAGVAGFGNTRGEGGLNYRSQSPRKQFIDSIEAPLVVGSAAAMPDFPIENNAGLLVGLPNDLRGSGGGKGGGLYTNGTLALDGPAGAVGGAGLLIVCRGMQVDSSAQIDLSGNDATATATQVIDLWGIRDPYCGAGAGGHPGGMLVLLDGDGLTAPAPSLTANNFIATTGASGPQPGLRLTEVSIASNKMDGSPDRCSYYTNYTDENGVIQRVGGTSNMVLTNECKRIQFVKKSKLPQPVYLLSTTPGSLVFQQTASPTNTDSQAMAKRDLKAGDMWYDSDDGNRAYRYDGASWVVASPSSVYQINSAEGLLASTSKIGAIFSEGFDDVNSPNYWVNYSGAGEISRVAITDSNCGGYALRVGNNSGNDQAHLIHSRNIPFDPSKLYRLRVRVRRTAGASGSISIGLTGVASDGSTLVNISGANLYTSPHFCAAAGVTPTIGSTWTLYTGYVQGFSASPSGTPATNINSPTAMHTNVRYVRPTVLVNASGAAGTTEIDSFFIDDVSNFDGVESASSGVSEVPLLTGTRNSTTGNQQFHPMISGTNINVNLHSSGTGIVVDAVGSEADHICAGGSQANATTTLANLTGMALAVEASKTYEIEGTLIFQSSVNTIGLKFQITGPSGSTISGYFLHQTTTAGVSQTQALGQSITATPTAGANYVCRYRAVVVNGVNAGVVQLQFAASGAGTVTAQAGSTMYLKQIRNVAPAAALTLGSTLGAASSYSHTIGAANLPATARLNLVINSDGTWSITKGVNGTLTGTPTSGNWATPTTSGAGSGYEMLIDNVSTSTSGPNSVTVSNPAGSYVNIASALTFYASLTDPKYNGGSTGSCTFRVTIRKVGTTTPICQQSITFNLSPTSDF